MTHSSLAHVHQISISHCWKSVSKISLKIAVLFALIVLQSSTAMAADQSVAKKKSLTDKLAKATKRATKQTYDLKYQFKKGMKFYWEVKHVVRTETSIQGEREVSRSHSLATKCWEVMDISKDGTATLIYCLTNVDMRHHVTGQPEICYNSRTDRKAPDHYQHIADSIGLSLATIELKPTGEVVRKQSNYRNVDLGMGDFTIKLPEKPVVVGHQWAARDEIIVSVEKDAKKRIATRKVYQLESVHQGVATITMRTEVLTPIHDPDIESQIVAKITEGTVKFDIEEGLVRNREIDWNKRVQGFRVPDSMMLYTAQLNESYSAENPDLKYKSIHQAGDVLEIKEPNAGPILRR